MRAGLVVLGLVALLALVACGGEDSSPETGAASSEGGSAASSGAPADAGKAAEPAGGAPPAPSSPGGGSDVEVTVIKPGSGPSPSADDTVVVHYQGTFPDGRVFDSSRDRGQPARFPLQRVIPCWTKGLQQMHLGETARLVCPPELAYGASGAPPTIPPNATLHFEVELLEIAR